MTALLFGKLPAHGDFIARGCSPEDRADLDDWLTASMAEAQRRFGAEFAQRFDTALPWRGVGHGAAGIIAASQDAAGRRYPLILMSAEREGLDEIVYAAIAERWDADRLVAAAGAAPVGTVDHWASPGGNSRREGARPVDIAAAMLAEPW